MKRWSICLALAMILGVAAGPAAALARSGIGRAATDPRVLCLQTSDVPHNFFLATEFSHYVSNAKVAREDKLSPATLRREGRLSEYQAQYQRSDMATASKAPPGLTLIESDVVSWKAPAGAHWGLEYSLGRTRSFKEKLMSMPAVGDEHFAFDHTTRITGVNYILYAVIFRQGKYLALVTIGGKAGTVTAARLEPYVNVVDRRILQKG